MSHVRQPRGLLILFVLSVPVVAACGASIRGIPTVAGIPGIASRAPAVASDSTGPVNLSRASRSGVTRNTPVEITPQQLPSGAVRQQRPGEDPALTLIADADRHFKAGQQELALGHVE